MCAGRRKGSAGQDPARRREEFLCLLIRGQGFKGSRRTLPWQHFGSSGAVGERGICRDDARTKWGPGAHPASLLPQERSGVWGCLSVQC